MTIINNLTNNRALVSSKESFVAPSQMISRYFWKIEGDFFIPYLLVDGGNGTSYSIRLEGELYLDFGPKHCLECGIIIPSESSLSICEDCQESIPFKYRRCIFEGPGKPFGTVCDPQKPACKSVRTASRCWGEHFVYIGRFGRIIKVGISNCSRSEGRYYRLIEQGLEEAVIIRGFESLAMALKAEANINDQFGFRTSISFSQKVAQIPTLEEESKIFDWRLIAEELQKIYRQATISYVDLINIWPRIERDFTAKPIKTPAKIEGKVVYSQGNVLIIKSASKDALEEEYLAYNLSYLSGYELQSPEEFSYRSKLDLEED